MKISLVSYLNSYPFHYGLIQAPRGLYSRLEIVNPAQCAKNFAEEISDVALVPVGALASLKNYKIIEPFCIAANGPVRSVLLLSNKSVDKIKTIAPDTDSRSSNQLVKVLCRNHWKIEPEFVPQELPSDAIIAIGDKAFSMAANFEFKYDLSDEWKNMTGLPFVFAVWISRIGMDESRLPNLNRALEFGVNFASEAISHFGSAGLPMSDAISYVKRNIRYRMDEDSKRGMEYFMNFSL